MTRERKVETAYLDESACALELVAGLSVLVHRIAKAIDEDD